MTHALIGLGSNLGDRSAQLDEVILRICGNPQIRWVAQSSYHQTRAIGGPSGQEAFLNAALRIETTLGPEALLAWTQHVEREMGRERLVRWGPRRIDIDVLLLGSHVIRSHELEIPHPRMTYRRFVLEPAAEIAGEMKHEPSGWTVAELLQHLRKSPNYLAVFGPPGLLVSRVAKRAAASCGARVLSDSIDLTHDPTAIWLPIDCRSDWNESQLEFLRRRSELQKAMLEDIKRDANSLVVSDFWTKETEALARARMSTKELEYFVEQSDHVVDTLAAPRLRVLIDAPVERLVEGLKAEGFDLADEEIRRLESYHQQLRDLAKAPLQGPLLQVFGGDCEVAHTEIIAAVAAMSVM
jgi:2-amino-4-hydroxy-6-hydroxymethyldihydropteridine diphosphokinase